MKLFRTPEAMYGEIATMVKAERYRREDRARVSGFFNGDPPLSDDEAADLGFTVNTNMLFGYTTVAEAKEQNFGMITKPARWLEVAIDAAPPGKRAIWQLKAQSHASRVLKKINSFKPHYEGVSGDGALHGEAVFFHGTTTFPLPKQVPLSKMLVPHKAPADPDRITHWCIEDDIELGELREFWRRKGKGWNGENLGHCLKKIYERKTTHGELDPDNCEEAEHERQTNTASGESLKTSLGVYYFYQRRSDLPGNPVDLTILLKTVEQYSGEENPKKRGVLFEADEWCPGVAHCLHPMFSDCIIGGAPLWHRVMGLGTLNYGLNHAIELLINRALQGTIEGTMNLWEARDGVTRDDLQQILLKHNGVVPEGVKLVQDRFPMDFPGVLQMIQFFRQQGSRNSRGVTPNNGDKNDQLEVQAMFEQNTAASTSNSRASNWYDYLDRMWTEAFARLTNPYIMPWQPGYSQCMDFQAAMKREGIPLYFLQPHNVEVKAVRLLGDGLRSKEMAIVAHLSNTRNQHPPEAQPRIMRIIDTLALDNAQLAEELNPIDESESEEKGVPPETENAIVLTTRVVLKLHASDVDEIHVMKHFPAMEQLIKDGIQFQNAAFRPQEADAFHKLGAHVYAHIQRIEQKAVQNRQDPERQKARAFTEQLNEMAAMGDKLSNNMQQAQEGQQSEPMSEGEKAKLQLQMESLQLQREKLTFAAEKYARTQGNREQTLAFTQMMQLEKERREADAHQRGAKIDDVKLALEIAKASEPAAKSA